MDLHFIFFPFFIVFLFADKIVEDVNNINLSESNEVEDDSNENVSSSDAKKKKKKQSKSEGLGETAKAVAAAITTNINSSSALSAVDLKKLSSQELVQWIQQQEHEKAKEAHKRKMEKQSLNGQDKDHKFWNTQPVLKLQEDCGIDESGPIDCAVDVVNVRKEPLSMPAGFEWCSLDVQNPDILQEIYVLLCKNYVEDDDCMFRFDYSKEFLQWALTPPAYEIDWHVGVRNSKTGALMGCITAVPADIRVYNVVTKMVEINFLCVHKKLRTHRLAPVLIKEITRRVNILGRWQAVYTAGVVLPKPVGKCRYYHRSLNPKKLIEVKFSSLPPKMTLASLIKKLKLAPKTAYNFVPMEREDMPTVLALLTENLSRRKLCQVFHEEELAHIMLPRDGVINSYVLKNKDGVVTDFCSFYHLPSTVIGNDKHKIMNAVYTYYNVATSISFHELMRDALILARNTGCDVYNALDMGDNLEVFLDLQFGAGDGNLQYYVYNWKCPSMDNSDIGLVLL